MAKSNGCLSARALAEFVAGALDETAARQVRDHLAGCAGCAAAVEKLRCSMESNTVLPSTKSWSLRAAATVGADGLGRDRLEDSNFDFTVLEPSSVPESLGRIGNYEVLSLLGQGGMGVVLKAFDARLDRAVAIKVLSRHLASSAMARRRFEREARAAAAINHPNVVTIHAVEEHRGLPFLVMELIKGSSLHQRIRAAGRLESAEVMRISTQIAAGLAAAHARNVIHRDIKPGNVMIEERAGLVKIADFGLARIMVDNAELSSLCAIVGTPSYMAPEQLSGEEIDARADLFSLGCLMYAMLTGQSPFQGRSSMEMTHKIAAFVPPPLCTLDLGIPTSLSNLVQRLLEKDPANRYQAAAEVGEALAGLPAAPAQATSAENSHLRSAPVSMPAQGRRRTPVLVAAGLALVMLAGAFAAWRYWSGGPDVPQPRPPHAARAPAEITVAADGRHADFPTITQALASAGPGTIIRVLDGATYPETITLADPKRLQGVKLVASPSGRGARPTLAAANPAAHALDIHGVSGVLVRGFRIQCPPNATALAIHGSLGGVVIEDVHYLVPAEMQVAQPTMVVNATATESPAAAITIRRCTVERPALGQCLRVDACPALALEDSRLHSEGVLMLLWETAPIADVTIRGNLFLGGLNGVNLNLVKPVPDRKVRINNNTFLGTRRWLGLVASDTSMPGVTIANNLILGAHKIEGDPAQLDKALQNWIFRANWWEADPMNTEADAGRDGRLADMKERIDLLQRDRPDGPDFLQPPPGSPLYSAGAGGDLPGFIGARGPLPRDRTQAK